MNANTKQKSTSLSGCMVTAGGYQIKWDEIQNAIHIIHCTMLSELAKQLNVMPFIVHILYLRLKLQVHTQNKWGCGWSVEILQAKFNV